MRVDVGEEQGENKQSLKFAVKELVYEIRSLR